MRKTLHEYQIELSDQVEKSKWNKVLLANENFWKVDKFAKLTNRAPKLGHFIPCDEDGKPITLSERGDKPEHERVEEQNKYQKALDRVIFKGDWEVIDEDNEWIQIRSNSLRIDVEFDGDVIGVVKWTKDWAYCSDKEINRIEDLPREIEFKEGVI